MATSKKGGARREVQDDGRRDHGPGAGARGLGSAVDRRALRVDFLRSQDRLVGPSFSDQVCLPPSPRRGAFGTTVPSVTKVLPR
jgi:hypothetical protein